MTREVILWTDGSVWTGDRIGAHAWVRVTEGHEDALGGYSEDDTTISRQELLGPIEGLSDILEEFGPCDVVVRSDSEYVCLGAMNPNRARNKNQDLWECLDFLMDQHHSVTFVHVRGHQGSLYNEIADMYAGELRKERQAQSV